MGQDVQEEILPIRFILSERCEDPTIRLVPRIPAILATVSTKRIQDPGGVCSTR